MNNKRVVRKKKTVKRYERMINRAAIVASLIFPLMGVVAIGSFMFGVAMMLGY